MTSVETLKNEAVLDLLSHFLGLATHDNVNAAPSGLRTSPSERRNWFVETGPGTAGVEAGDDLPRSLFA